MGSADNAPRHFDSAEFAVLLPPHLQDEASLHSALGPLYAKISGPQIGTLGDSGAGE